MADAFIDRRIHDRGLPDPGDLLRLLAGTAAGADGGDGSDSSGPPVGAARLTQVAGTEATILATGKSDTGLASPRRMAPGLRSWVAPAEIAAIAVVRLAPEFFPPPFHFRSLCRPCL